MAITPPRPPSGATISSIFSQASASASPTFTLLATSCAAHVLMNASPTPVHDTATLSSAQVPAPMIGVSPILPSGFPVIPPVLVAAASTPLESMATAPTVPIPSPS